MLPGERLDRYVGQPLNAVSPEYGPKTIDLCAPGDPIPPQRDRPPPEA
jgi:cutinase